MDLSIWDPQRNPGNPPGFLVATVASLLFPAQLRAEPRHQGLVGQDLAQHFGRWDFHGFISCIPQDFLWSSMIFIDFPWCSAWIFLWSSIIWSMMCNFSGCSVNLPWFFHVASPKGQRWPHQAHLGGPLSHLRLRTEPSYGQSWVPWKLWALTGWCTNLFYDGYDKTHTKPKCGRSTKGEAAKYQNSFTGSPSALSKSLRVLHQITAKSKKKPTLAAFASSSPVTLALQSCSSNFAVQGLQWNCVRNPKKRHIIQRWTPPLDSDFDFHPTIPEFFWGSLNMFQQPATLSPPAACMSCWSWEWSWRKCKRSSWDAPKIPPNLVCFSWPMILVINDMQPATHVLQICGNIQNIPLPPLGWAQLAVSLLPPQRLLPETSMMWLWRTSTEAQTT